MPRMFDLILRGDVRTRGDRLKTLQAAVPVVADNVAEYLWADVAETMYLILTMTRVLTIPNRQPARGWVGIGFRFDADTLYNMVRKTAEPTRAQLFDGEDPVHASALT